MRIFINRIAELIVKHLNGELTVTEEQELNNWINRSEKEKTFFAQVTNSEYITEQLEQLYSYDKEKGWDKLINEFPFLEPKVIKFFNWKKIAVAASVLLVIGLG